MDLEKLNVVLELQHQKFLNNLTQAQVQTSRQLSAIEKRFAATTAHVRQSSTAMGAALGGIGAYVGVRAVTEYANSWTRLTRSIDSGGRVFGIALKPAEELNELANDARIDAEAYTKTYIRTAAAIRDYGYDSDAAAKITSTLAKALKLGSASASEQASTILQFSQALQKGKLDGDEFRTVMENAGVIQELLAERLGVTKGEIVKMAAEGKLQIRDLAGAMLDGGAKIERIFRQMPATVDEAFVVLRNNVVQFIGHADQATGASQALADGIVKISKNLDILAVAVGAVLGSATLRMSAFAAATVAAANPLTLLAAAVGALTVAYGVFGEEVKVTDDGVVSLKDALSAFAKVAGEDANVAISNITKSLEISRKEISANKSAWSEFSDHVTKKASEIERAFKLSLQFLTQTASQGIRDGMGLGPDRWEHEARMISAQRSLAQRNYGAGLGNYLEGKLDYTPKPLGDAKSDSKKSQYEREVDAIKKRTAALQAELQVIDATTYSRERSKAAAELQHALTLTAAKEGRKITSEEQEAVGKLADAYAKAAVQIEFLQKLQDTRQENEDLEHEIALTGLYGEALEKARKEQELLIAAKRAGIELTSEQKEEINRLADQNARLQETQKLISDVRDQSRDALKGFITDLRDGASATEALGNALTRMSDKLIDMAVNGLVEAALGPLFKGGPNSAIGNLLGLSGGDVGLGSWAPFADGGYTGPGGKNQPAGVVHKGEVVWSQDDVARAGGVAAVEAMRRGMPGYASGGPVAIPTINVPNVPTAVTPVRGGGAGPVVMNVTINAPNATPAGVDALNNTTLPQLKKLINHVVDEKFVRQERYRRPGVI